MEKKIKSVKRNGSEYVRYSGTEMWQSKVPFSGSLREWVTEDVVLNCPLFGIEYEEEVPTEIEELKKQLQYCTEGLEKIVAKYVGNK